MENKVKPNYMLNPRDLLKTKPSIHSKILESVLIVFPDNHLIKLEINKKGEKGAQKLEIKDKLIFLSKNMSQRCNQNQNFRIYC